MNLASRVKTGLFKRMMIIDNTRLRKSVENINIKEDLEILKRNSDHVFQIFAGIEVHVYYICNCYVFDKSLLY